MDDKYGPKGKPWPPTGVEVGGHVVPDGKTPCPDCGQVHPTLEDFDEHERMLINRMVDVSRRLEDGSPRDTLMRLAREGTPDEQALAQKFLYGLAKVNEKLKAVGDGAVAMMVSEVEDFKTALLALARMPGGENDVTPYHTMIRMVEGNLASPGLVALARAILTGGARAGQVPKELHARIERACSQEAPPELAPAVAQGSRFRVWVGMWVVATDVCEQRAGTKGRHAPESRNGYPIFETPVLEEAVRVNREYMGAVVELRSTGGASTDRFGVWSDVIKAWRIASSHEPQHPHLRDMRTPVFCGTLEEATEKCTVSGIEGWRVRQFTAEEMEGPTRTAAPAVWSGVNPTHRSVKHDGLAECRVEMEDGAERFVGTLTQADKVQLLREKEGQRGCEIRRMTNKEAGRQEESMEPSVQKKPETTTQGEKTAAASDQSKRKLVTLARGGDQIVLPDGMTYKEGRDWLSKMEQDEQTKVAVFELFDCYPLEGAWAMAHALDNIYGFFQAVATPGLWTDTPPVMVGIETGLNTIERVPWGRITLPGMKGHLESGMGLKDNRVVFSLRGEVTKGDSPTVARIVAEMNRILKEESIYRGKAFKVSFVDPQSGQFNPLDGPKFIDTTRAKPEELIFSADVQRVFEDSVLTPIQKTDLCRKYGVPLKRGVLFEGPYGVGKTLAAHVVGRHCEENGWTFIYLRDVAQLQQAILFARQYQPAVIFAEDIDRAVTGERTAEIDNILNTIDGVDTKTNELMVILTTNHVEEINSAMLRPGRLDAVISVRAPDSEAAQRLVRLYAREMLPQDEDLKLVGLRLAGQIPATIREVVERSKLGAIRRTEPGQPLLVRAPDIITAAEGMLNHLKLIAVRPKDTRSKMERAAEVLGQHVAQALRPKVPQANGSSRTLPSLEDPILDTTYPPPGE